MHKWYQEAGEQNDVVISTRVRWRAVCRGIRIRSG